MADPKNNAKATGDTHLPEVESDDFDTERGHPEGTGTEGTQARGRLTLKTTRRQGRHAGELRDPDSPSAGNGSGNGRSGDDRR